MIQRSRAIYFIILMISLSLLPGLACSLTGESASTPTPTLELKSTPMDIEGKVIVDDSPLRSSPGKEHTQLGVVKKNEKVKVVAVSSDGNWYQIVTPDSVPGVLKDLKVWISVLFVELPPPPDAFPLPGSDLPLLTPAPF